ncbi:MAG: hypothetical protein PHC75_01295 [Burkholderiales bacterium]|nr:hypothetical protein [Burkholderiales bacterium]
MKNYKRNINLNLIYQTAKINVKLIIAVFIPLMILVTVYAYMSNKRQTPKYTVTGTLQINNRASLIDNDSDFLDDVKMPKATQSGIAVNSEVIYSLLTKQYILNKVIEENKLDISLVVDQNNNSKVSKFNRNVKQPIPEVDTFSVPKELINKTFRLKCIKNNKFELFNGTSSIGSGNIGTDVKFNKILINLSSCSDYSNSFLISKLMMSQVQQNLLNNLVVEPVLVSRRLSQNDTGIIDISMVGINPTRQAIIINDIMDELREKVFDRQRQSLKQMLNFLQQQVVLAKKSLDEAKDKLVDYQENNQILDLYIQNSTYVSAKSQIELQLLEKNIMLYQYSNQYTNSHPLIISLLKQQKLLEEKVKQLDSQLTKLPAEQAKYVTLKSDVDVAQELYTSLVNKEQVLYLKYYGITSTVDILTYANSSVVPVTIPLSAKVIVTNLFLLLSCELLIIMYFVFFNQSDPNLLPSLLDSKLLINIPYLKTRKISHRENYPYFKVLYSYFILLSESRQDCVICNVSSIDKGCGKSFVLLPIINQLSLTNKICYISFVNDDSGVNLHQVINNMDQISLNGTNNNIVIKVNESSVMGLESLRNMIFKVKEVLGVDFIFIESPAIIYSKIFMDISRIATHNVLVSIPSDKSGVIAHLVQWLDNLSINIDSVIFNHPKRQFIKTTNYIDTLSHKN